MIITTHEREKKETAQSGLKNQPLFGYAMLLTALVAGLAVTAFGAKVAGMLVTALIPVLLIAAFIDPSIYSPYTVLARR